MSDQTKDAAALQQAVVESFFGVVTNPDDPQVIANADQILFDLDLVLADAAAAEQSA